jgi:hypothetical protein
MDVQYLRFSVHIGMYFGYIELLVYLLCTLFPMYGQIGPCVGVAHVLEWPMCWSGLCVGVAHVLEWAIFAFTFLCTDVKKLVSFFAVVAVRSSELYWLYEMLVSYLSF